MAEANIPDAGGIHESHFEDNPTAELNLTHTVVVRLEACDTHPGDTHTEEGVDEIPYFFAAPTDLIVSVAEEEFDEAVTLVLLDGLGVEVARVEPGGDSELVTVSGPYTMLLEHPNAGDCDAEPIVLFLRPGAPVARQPGGSGVRRWRGHRRGGDTQRRHGLHILRPERHQLERLRCVHWRADDRNRWNRPHRSQIQYGAPCVRATDQRVHGQCRF